MKTFTEWLELKEISSNLLSRAADAAAARGDMKGDRLQSKFLQGADAAAARAGKLPRARSWTSTPVEPGMNQNLIPNYSAIKYFFKGEGGKMEEGSFVIRSIKYNPSYSDWFRKERAKAWSRTRGEDGISYSKPSDPSVSGRLPDYRTIYEITTTKGEKIEVVGMAEAATMWQMGEPPRILKPDDRLQLKLNEKDIFPDGPSAVELARQINKFDYEQIMAFSKRPIYGDPSMAQGSSHSLYDKPKNALDFSGIKPTHIKQA